MQLTTKSGKPIINRNTKTPIYSKPVDIRIKNVKSQLINNQDDMFQTKWQLICQNVRVLGI